MKREDLEKLGITDKEQLDNIMALHGQDIESHKTKVTTAQEEVKTVKDQLKEAAKQIEDFKGMDVEGIKKASDDWKTKFENAQKDAETKMNQLKFEHALDGALSGAKAKNQKAVKALLNTEGLKLLEDGSILGLKEQLEKIKSENDYLFEGEKVDPKIVGQTSGAKVTSDAIVEAARQAAGLSSSNGEK